KRQRLPCAIADALRGLVDFIYAVDHGLNVRLAESGPKASYFPADICRSLKRCTLPVAVRGSASMKWMRCGRLKRGRFFAACSLISWASLSPAWLPGRNAT